MTFSGGTDPQGVSGYDEELDGPRLTTQIERVWALTRNSGWWSYADIAARTGDPENSISAHLRSFRKEKHGEHTMEKRKVPGSDETKGHWEYRVTDSGTGLLMPSKVVSPKANPDTTDMMTCPTCDGTGDIPT